MLKKGFVFTGKYFTGRVEVLEVKEETDELYVKLHHVKHPKENDQHWFETWDLQVVKNTWGDAYFLIQYDIEDEQ